MSSPTKETEEPSSSHAGNAAGNIGDATAAERRPPAKRQIPSTVIEISDTDSDDSDVCAVNSYQASADEVKRIRREYSSTSCSSDYSSDSESSWEDDSIVIEDKITGKAVRAQLNPRANRMDNPKLNSNLKSQEVIDKVKTYWEENKDHSSAEVTLTCKPFRLCRLHDLLENSEIINNIVDDMNTLDWSRKKMDLYEFHQTTDLANLTWQRSIRGIYELLKTEVMSLVSQVTGLELSSVSASCSLYGPGDHLLVHDDRLGDRRVAFILYLAPWSPRAPPPALRNGAPGADEPGDVDVRETSGDGWAPNMGGALELFQCDDEGCPTRVALRAFPANNTLAFFGVGPRSFHQVGEVLSLELPRLSINGWFHGPAPPAAPAAAPPPAPLAPHAQVVLLNQWLAGAYLSPRVRAQVQAQMERASEASLGDVLLPARVAQLLAALRLADVAWERCGPAQQRRYERVAAAWLAAGTDAPEHEHPVRGLLRVLSSAAFLRLLADCTDLPLAAYRRLELQRWRAGDFTLLPPREHYERPRLEAVLYLGVPEHPICGGQTLFVAPEEAEAEAETALVTLPPAHNSLNLVYCDAGAACFTKYLSKLTMTPQELFYIVTCTYTE
ncbi:prolyl 3-hydroxylase sudestada1 isoform X2 [Pararge aegeria]|uniref:prolyl 3-hydroxylase sudestada1 isoform X2 n=1 Tax=Pararge aegeria TaxID=116150 RepID=UPI0019D137DD|nr:prolyl 3-hydroxylase sudestada1 isoform X2 [Pararge aegeria]